MRTSTFLVWLEIGDQVTLSALFSALKCCTQAQQVQRAVPKFLILYKVILCAIIWMESDTWLFYRHQA